MTGFMSRALLILIVLAPAFHTPAQDAAVPAEIKRTLLQSVQHSLSVFRHDFDVMLTSDQLTMLLERTVTGGAPFPVRVKQLYVKQRQGEGTFEVSIDGLPPAMRVDLEAQANDLIRKSDFNKLWAKLTRSFLEDAEKVLQEGWDLKATRPGGDLLVVDLEGMDRPFHKDLTLNAIKLVVDEKLKLVKGARLSLNKDRNLIVKMNYEEVTIPGEAEPVPVWSSLRIQDNTWLGRLLGFAGWPNKLDVDYHDYQFLAPRPAIGTPSP